MNEPITLPGFVDLHVHLREPGFSQKETLRTGAMAALRGGYAAVCAMPNLNPPMDTLAHLRLQTERIPRELPLEILPVGAITMGRAGEGRLSDMEALAPHVCGFSDDGTGIRDGAIMQEAMARAKALGKPILSHCEDETLVNGGYIHAGAYAKAHGHRGISSESEWVPLARDLELCARTGCHYHVCHVSAKESVALVRQAKASGLPVSCETAPHYLLLTEDDLREDGRFKMNPPLRTQKDRAALLEGLLDGTIDCVATDHAPHTREEKSRGLAGSAFGVVGLETAFPVLYTKLVRGGILSLDTLVDRMSARPRRLLEGWLGRPLAPRAFTWDLSVHYTINPEHFASLGRATPFAGWEAFGQITSNN